MRQRSLITLGLVIITLMTSCGGESKKVQCSKFAKVRAQVQDVLKDNSTQNKSPDKTVTAKTIEDFQKLARESASSMTQRVTSINQAAKIIEELSVSDDRLQTLKAEYLGIIKKAANATNSIVDIYTAKSKATVKTMTEPSFKQLDKDFITTIDTFTAAVTEEAQFVSKLSIYCSTK